MKMSNEHRNILRMMAEGYELFVWAKGGNFPLLSKQDYKLDSRKVKQKTLDELLSLGFVRKADSIYAARWFYTLTPLGKQESA